MPFALVARPLVRLWAGWRDTALLVVPRPDDAPVARAAGPDLRRLLLVGNGPAVGWGVRSHDLALPGQLTRALAARTDDGVQVDVRADPDRRYADLPEALTALPAEQYDAVLVVGGMSDAVRMVPLRRWRRDVGALLDRVAEVAPSAPVLVVGVQEVRSVSVYAGWPSRLVEPHRAAMNRITREVCGERGAVFAPLTASAEPTDRPGHRSPGAYAEWAEQIAGPLLEVLRARPAVAREPQPEAARQRAVDRLPPADPRDQRLDRITATARETFGTAIAGISLLDHDLHRFRSAVGVDPAPLPRAWSICAQTVLADAPLVVGDLAADARFDGNPLVHGETGLRFYAGYPIESPDGYRVGALCVLDTEPHDPAGVDVVALSALALLAQKELWGSGARAS